MTLVTILFFALIASIVYLYIGQKTVSLFDFLGGYAAIENDDTRVAWAQGLTIIFWPIFIALVIVVAVGAVLVNAYKLISELIRKK